MYQNAHYCLQCRKKTAFIDSLLLQSATEQLNNNDDVEANVRGTLRIETIGQK